MNIYLSPNKRRAAVRAGVTLVVTLLATACGSSQKPAAQQQDKLIGTWKLAVESKISANHKDTDSRFDSRERLEVHQYKNGKRFVHRIKHIRLSNTNKRGFDWVVEEKHDYVHQKDEIKLSDNSHGKPVAASHKILKLDDKELVTSFPDDEVQIERTFKRISEADMEKLLPEDLAPPAENKKEVTPKEVTPKKDPAPAPKVVEPNKNPASVKPPVDPKKTPATVSKEEAQKVFDLFWQKLLRGTMPIPDPKSLPKKGPVKPEPKPKAKPQSPNKPDTEKKQSPVGP